ncbi:MAG: hypothetical protein WBW79_18675 [Desulfocapsaceae bacterium]
MAASSFISFGRYLIKAIFCVAFLLLIYLIGSQMLDLVGNFGLSLGLSAQSTRIAATVCGAVFLALCLLVLLHFFAKDD